MSTREYAQFSYSTPKSQHLHTSVQQSIHHQYAQQPYTNPQDGLITQTASGTTSQFTTTSIAPTLGGGTRRYNTQHTSIAPPTPNTHRQYSQHSLSLENPPPTSSSLASNQCLPTTNNVTISSSISSSLPASLPTPPTTLPSGLPSPSGTTTSTTNFDLQDVIAQFGAQPELLKLILTSKVEEDKRKAEEAKLRVRELDLLLFERDRQKKCLEHAHDVAESKNNEIHSNQDMDYENESSNGTFSTSDGSLNYASFNTTLSAPVQSLSLNSPGTPVSQSTPRLKSAPRLNSTPKAIQNDQEAVIGSAENDESNADNPTNKRKRKRREMLAVTKIVETKVSPYVDEYLWKNNGNTTVKKTGFKSVYYKCSNSNKGCPVNKTVTETENGWIIKYRGNHLDECGKITRIVQS